MNKPRRGFLRLAAAVLAGARQLLRGQAHPSAAHPRRQSLTPEAAPRYTVLDTHQARTVEAICEQIIPADDQPGARGAGVVHYIDRSLAGELRRFRKDYIEGLARVDRESSRAYGKPFTVLTSDQQIAILKSLEADPGAGGQFFNLIRMHTMEGYYGDAKYGGNRNYVSWKMLGFRG